MCYKNPGPRCSAHASKALILAKQKQNLINTPEHYIKYERRIQKAQKDYDMTPAGMLELRRRVKSYANNPKACKEYKDRLEEAQMMRKAKLAAIKTEDNGDIFHKIQGSEVYGVIDFPEEEEDRKQILETDPSVTKMIKESAKWMSINTPEEIEALSWLTSNGSSVVNTYLYTGSTKTGPWTTDEGHIKNTIKNLDTAIAKFRRRNPIIVYRGITLRDNEGEEIYDTDEATQKFTVGETYTSKPYASSSLDPMTACSFSKSEILFEIKTKKAAPIINVSAWDLTEKEFILPRNQEYKIVNIIRNATIGGDKTETTIVQLEDIEQNY